MKIIVHFDGHPDSFEKEVVPTPTGLPDVGEAVRVLPPGGGEPLPGHVVRREFEEVRIIVPEQYQIGGPKLTSLVAHLYVEQA